jgi:hypothetical protein
MFWRVGIIMVNTSCQDFIKPALDTRLEKAGNTFDLNFLIEARGCVVNHASAAKYLSMPFGSQRPS